MAWNHCPICGAPLVQADDGQSLRPHCAACARFYYSNPAPAACCLVRDGEKLLFVQRSVEPRKGFWTLPGGFIEMGETAEQAALRELREETALIGRGTELVGVATRQSRTAGGLIVIAYAISEWVGDPVPDTDAMALGFFAKHERPPIAFDAHEELLALYDARFTP